MKKMFLIFGFLALASIAASAAPVTYSFDGYCDSITVNLYGTPKTIFGATHNFFDCANSVNAGGFKHGLAAGYQTGTGAVLDVSDPIGPYLIGPVSVQFLINALHGQCSWVIYEGSDGVGNYVLNAGTCSKAGMVKKGATQKFSASRQ